MQQVLGDRVVGICDSPIGLSRRAARALDLHPDLTTADYVGLNHLGWLRRLSFDGADVLPSLVADADALATIEEGRLFGADWIAALGCIPNEYLYYYYFTRDAVASIKGSPATRGEFLLRQQRDFYNAVAKEPSKALAEWRRVREERDATYMAESRAETDPGRDKEDIAGGGYEGVALALMAAISRGERTAMILNVRNGSAVPGLAPEGGRRGAVHRRRERSAPARDQPIGRRSVGLGATGEGGRAVDDRSGPQWFGIGGVDGVRGSSTGGFGLHGQSSAFRLPEPDPRGGGCVALSLKTDNCSCPQSRLPA
ncbi:family 4 glycosyl hydrolase [Fodinicola feengrottensis]